MKVLHSLLAFNRGLVSRLALARIDISRISLSAETFVNWMPRVLGSMMLRPGSTYLHSTHNNSESVSIPFIYATDDQAIIELTDSVMRVIVDDEVITRPTISTTITNGTFLTDLTGWTDSDESGGVSSWATGGYLSLVGDGVNEARRDQTLTVSDTGIEHSLYIRIANGTAKLSIGSTSGGGEYWDRIELKEGYHSISFTPDDDVYVRLASATIAPTLVDFAIIGTAGTMQIATPWGPETFDNIRYEQSADVIFVCDGANSQRRIERHGPRSWSVVKYLPDGPWIGQNLTDITITPSGLDGSITLTASKPLFKLSHIGGQFRLESTGQQVSASVTAEDQYSNYIRVTGIESGRTFGIVIGGTFTATVTLQRSLGAAGDWTDVSVYTTPQAITYNDTLDNQIAYYRLGVKPGDFSSGTVEIDLTYAAGSILGKARITGYTNSTVVTADVVSDMGATTATSTWWEGAWSDYRGYPSAVALHDGRLFWAGNDRIDGSVSDDFANFDDQIEGDSGPISRNIGSGPVNKINWLLSLAQLLVGTQGDERVAKASSLEEPLTPSAFSLKRVSSIGSGNVKPVLLDSSGVFVGRGGTRVNEIAYDVAQYSYATNDLTGLYPEVGEPEIVRVGVQRLPDTRIHCVRSDGTVTILVFDRIEKVTCWIEYTTDGEVEDVVVLNGTVEDSVYYVVKRTINGNTKRYREKWALESEGRGSDRTILTDCSYIYSGVSTDTITGLSHLEGETVIAWGNTKDLGEYTVTGGEITLSEAVTDAYIGLYYKGQWKSSKLAVASQAQSPLTQRKRIDHLGVILADTHAQGLKYGQDFDHMDDLPLYDKGAAVNTDSIHENVDMDSFELNGTWDTDARLCLEAESPKPCRSVPAFSARTADSPAWYFLETPFMTIASVTTSPWYPSSSFNRRVEIAGETVAGSPETVSNAVAAIWATITDRTPPANAFSKGGSSTLSKRAFDRFSTGRSR